MTKERVGIKRERMLAAMAKLLLAENSKENIAKLTKLLKDQYEIITAADGTELAKVAGSKKPDLIMLGPGLAAEGGLTQCGLLKRQAATQDIPVIILAGAAAGPAEIFAAGAQDYLPADFSPAELFARIRLHLELREARLTLHEYDRRLAEKNFQLRDMAEQLESMARIDLLTDLPNRQYMLERLSDEASRAFRHQRALTIIIANIDGFKTVVAKHGKECGDYILQAIATTLRTNRRGQDVVARWGKDQFMLMLPETYLPDGGRLAERIRARIEGTDFDEAGKAVRVTMTLGVAEFSPEWGIEGTIKLAESAVNRGKQASKNCVVLSAG